MTELTHLSLFSGIGGLDLAAEWAGFRSVGQCEWADYPTKVLEKHWPDVPRWRDIRTLTGDDFYARTGRRSVTVISGGFPCQPFSVAGKRRGKEDDRYLWPEMCRVISEIQPSWIVGENVPGIVNLALDTVLSDLESQGYTCQTFIIPACGVDAPHRRERICIVGYAEHNGLSSAEITRSFAATGNYIKKRQNAAGKSTGTSKPGYRADVANSYRHGAGNRGDWNSIYDIKLDDTAQECRRNDVKYGAGSDREDVADAKIAECQRERREAWKRRTEFGCGCWWPAEPNVGRVANGIPSRVDRLKCLGNAVVPQQFYPFFKFIAEIERRERK